MVKWWWSLFSKTHVERPNKLFKYLIVNRLAADEHGDTARHSFVHPSQSIRGDWPFEWIENAFVPIEVYHFFIRPQPRQVAFHRKFYFNSDKHSKDWTLNHRDIGDSFSTHAQAHTHAGEPGRARLRSLCKMIKITHSNRWMRWIECCDDSTIQLSHIYFRNGFAVYLPWTNLYVHVDGEAAAAAAAQSTKHYKIG